jgi:flagellar hook-associated protein 2
MASISSLGIGSGIDINSLVEQIVAAEREPTVQRLDLEEGEYQAELSSYGVLKGALSSFQTTLNSLRSTSDFLGVSATVGDTAALSVSATSNASAGSYTLQVNKLAQTHSLASAAFSSTTDTIGTGVLTFTFGATTYDGSDNYTGFSQNPDKTSKDVVITDGTLEGIRDAVNNANIGVTASIVNVGSDSYKLLFTTDDKGANNSMEITVADDQTDNIDTTGLSQLAYNINATNMTEQLRAQDAEVKFNGLTVTRSSNTITDLVAGVTLNLKAVSANGSTTLDVSRQSNKISSAVDKFVKGYNELVTAMNSLSSYDSDSGQAGFLVGDSVWRNIDSQIRRTINEAIPNIGSSYSSLASIGITTDKDGMLKVNSTKLDAAAADDPEAVARLFAIGGKASGENLRYIGSTRNTKAGLYSVEVTQAAAKGYYTAAANSTLIIGGANDTFALRVDSTLSATIELTNKTYNTGNELALEMQAQINADSALTGAGVKVTVSYDTDHFVITSNKYGIDSSVEITTANADLGLSGGVSTAGKDVAGTIGGVAATGDGQFLTGAGDAAGMEIEYQGSVTGSVGGITFARGYADKLYNLLDDFLASDGAIEGKTDGINASIEDISEQRVALDKRMLSLDERLRSQFATMDAIVAQLKSTGDFLTQQLDSLPEIKVR